MVFIFLQVRQVLQIHQNIQQVVCYAYNNDIFTMSCKIDSINYPFCVVDSLRYAIVLLVENVLCFRLAVSMRSAAKKNYGQIALCITP